MGSHRGATLHGRVPLLLALVPGLAYQAWFVAAGRYPDAGRPPFVLVDDAMISMTYGRTLAQTGELVWFPGAPRVEGFTNLLWTLYMALLHALGLAGSSAALAVMATNGVLLLATAIVAQALVGRLLGPDAGAPPRLLAAGGVPLLFPLTYWSLRGMETGLIALVLAVAALASFGTLRRWAEGRAAHALPWLLGAAASLGIATRLDVAVLVGVPVLALLLWAPTGRDRLAVIVAAALPAALALGGVVAFQALYYGDWLPNTYHLKMEGFGLADRLLRGLLASGKVLPMLCLAAWGWAGCRLLPDAVARRSASVLAGVVAAAWAYSVWVGGDAWESFQFTNRYQCVVLPLMLVLMIAGVSATATNLRSVRGVRWPVVGTAVAGGLASGLTTNPVNYLVAVGVGEAVVLALASLAVLERLGGPRADGRRALALAVVAFLAVSSLFPAVLIARVGVDTGEGLDAHLGRLVAAGTSADARIAVTTAGASGYYAGRPMIDLLGKSDRRIALGPPATVDPQNPALAPFTTFYPGHNKWDYGYSIGDLRPDVVLYLFHTETLPELTRWGYERRCLDGFPVHVLRGSTKVDPAVFVPCPR